MLSSILNYRSSLEFGVFHTHTSSGIVNQIKVDALQATGSLKPCDV